VREGNSHHILKGPAMSENRRTIIHHHKLETSTKLILAAIAVAMVLQVFAPSMSVTNALGDNLSGRFQISHSGSIRCTGCN